MAAEPRVWVFDDFAEPIRNPVPPADSPVWEARYDNDVERGKRTCRLVPPEYQPTLNRMRGMAADLSGLLGYPVTDDPTLHGGGLHVTAPGGHLSCHLDYDRHPREDECPNKRRAVNLIWFCHPEWHAQWGGEFYLADPMGVPRHRFYPWPGRLIVFEVGDLSYHGHLPTSHDAADRVSLAVYFLNEATGTNTRRRALFLPTR